MPHYTILSYTLFAYRTILGQYFYVASGICISILCVVKIQSITNRLSLLRRERERERALQWEIDIRIYATSYRQRREQCTYSTVLLGEHSYTYPTSCPICCRSVNTVPRFEIRVFVYGMTSIIISTPIFHQAIQADDMCLLLFLCSFFFYLRYLFIYSLTVCLVWFGLVWFGLVWFFKESMHSCIYLFIFVVFFGVLFLSLL